MTQKFILYEWIPTLSTSLAKITYPYLIISTPLDEGENNWRFVARGSSAEMQALEALMLATLNRTKGEYDGQETTT